jgi:antitoxin VapB
LTPPEDGIYFWVSTNNQEEAMMKTAKLFRNGRSQAVRLPKAYRFEGNEVYIKKVAGGVLLISKNQSIWDLWEKNLMKYEEPFMTERNQPELQQEREILD